MTHSPQVYIIATGQATRCRQGTDNGRLPKCLVSNKQSSLLIQQYEYWQKQLPGCLVHVVVSEKHASITKDFCVLNKLKYARVHALPGNPSNTLAFSNVWPRWHSAIVQWSDVVPTTDMPDFDKAKPTAFVATDGFYRLGPTSDHRFMGIYYFPASRLGEGELTCYKDVGEYALDNAEFALWNGVLDFGEDHKLTEPAAGYVGGSSITYSGEFVTKRFESSREALRTLDFVAKSHLPFVAHKLKSPWELQMCNLRGLGYSPLFEQSPLQALLGVSRLGQLASMNSYYGRCEFDYFAKLEGRLAGSDFFARNASMLRALSKEAKHSNVLVKPEYWHGDYNLFNVWMNGDTIALIDPKLSQTPYLLSYELGKLLYGLGPWQAPMNGPWAFSYKTMRNLRDNLPSECALWACLHLFSATPFMARHGKLLARWMEYAEQCLFLQ